MKKNAECGFFRSPSGAVCPHIKWLVQYVSYKIILHPPIPLNSLLLGDRRQELKIAILSTIEDCLENEAQRPNRTLKIPGKYTIERLEDVVHSFEGTLLREKLESMRDIVSRVPPTEDTAYVIDEVASYIRQYNEGGGLSSNSEISLFKKSPLKSEDKKAVNKNPSDFFSELGTKALQHEALLESHKLDLQKKVEVIQQNATDETRKSIEAYLLEAADLYKKILSELTTEFNSFQSYGSIFGKKPEEARIKVNPTTIETLLNRITTTRAEVSSGEGFLSLNTPEIGSFYWDQFLEVMIDVECRAEEEEKRFAQNLRKTMIQQTNVVKTILDQFIALFKRWLKDILYPNTNPSSTSTFFSKESAVGFLKDIEKRLKSTGLYFEGSADAPQALSDDERKLIFFAKVMGLALKLEVFDKRDLKPNFNTLLEGSPNRRCKRTTTKSSSEQFFDYFEKRNK